jgi:hypothetical protein
MLQCNKPQQGYEQSAQTKSDAMAAVGDQQKMSLLLSEDKNTESSGTAPTSAAGATEMTGFWAARPGNGNYFGLASITVENISRSTLESTVIASQCYIMDMPNLCLMTVLAS